MRTIIIVGILLCLCGVALAVPDAGLLAAPAAVASGSVPWWASLLGWSDKAVAWALTWLAGIVSVYVIRRYFAGKVADVLGRAWNEVVHAVLEVRQTYVDALKAASADGVLTADERSLAKSKAIAIAKANIGVKGLAALGRIVGLDVEKWLGSRVESAVATLKTPVAGKKAEKAAAPSGPR